MSDLKAKMHPKSISAGAPPPDPSRELTALPSSLAGFKGRTSKWRGGEGREGEGRGVEMNECVNMGPRMVNILYMGVDHGGQGGQVPPEFGAGGR